MIACTQTSVCWPAYRCLCSCASDRALQHPASQVQLQTNCKFPQANWYVGTACALRFKHSRSWHAKQRTGAVPAAPKAPCLGAAGTAPHRCLACQDTSGGNGTPCCPASGPGASPSVHSQGDNLSQIVMPRSLHDDAHANTGHIFRCQSSSSALPPVLRLFERCLSRLASLSARRPALLHLSLLILLAPKAI